jgi:hypothetical protein
MIIPRMRDLLRAFIAELADEPHPAYNPAVTLFRDGRSVAQVVAHIAPELGGPAIRQAQIEVEGYLRGGIDQQARVIREQAETIEELREYAGRLEHEIISLRRALAQRAAAE